MRYLILLISSLTILVSCQDVIEFETSEAVRSLAVDGRITDTSGVMVQLSLTTGYFADGAVPYINDAEVYLYEDGQFLRELPAMDTSGTYYHEASGTQGRSYHIEIQLPDHYGLPLTWQSHPEQLKPVFEPDSMNIRYLDRTTVPSVFEEGHYGLLYFKEPDTEGDQYRFKRWLNDSAFSQEFFVWDDRNINGLQFGGPVPGFGVYGPLDEGDSLSVEVSSLTRSYYEFLVLVNEQVFQVGGPFSPPPAPIVGNIYNVEDPEEFGFGYFAASSLRYAWAKR